MCLRIVKSFGGLLLVAAVLWVAFTLAMRAKYPPLLTGIRKMNRAATNPRQMGTAGQPGAYASIVRHVGRNSGTPYETPVQALPTDDGFVIPLPYGDTADWMKNVLAAGTASIVNEGADHTVDRPEIVPTDKALAYVPRKYQWSLRLYGVDTFLQVRLAEDQSAAG